MKKIIFPILAAAMLMSFVAVDSESAPKVKATNKVTLSSCSYNVSGSPTGPHPSVTVILPGGGTIQQSGSFSQNINVSNGSMATITSNNFNVRVNGTSVICSNGTTSVQFLNSPGFCEFTGGSCGNQQ